MRPLPFLFCITLISSAFLSFSVQPILGKMLLPMVGGAPNSWIVAMAFFQLALLAGYGISYVLGRFSPWVHAGALMALYLAGVHFLPPVLPVLPGGVQGLDLSIDVFKALLQTILVPFLALTATTAALQRVFAATDDPTAKDPYYLFVASNAGSFAGLFVYPFLLEPLTGLSWQAHLWKAVYAIAVILIALCTMAAWRRKAKPHKEKAQKASRQKIPAKQIALWIALSFVPCSLSMGVTSLITTDIGGFPLFWVLPLGLYLLTFIIAFSPKPFLRKDRADMYHMTAAVFMILFMALEIGYQPTGDLLVFGFLATLLLGIFFFTAWACHQKLADSRPDPSHLALFYFILALGGGLAGILHAFVLPFVLPGMIEFPVMVIVSLLFTRDLLTIKDARTRKLAKVTLIVTLVGCAAGLLTCYFRLHQVPRHIYAPFMYIFLLTVLISAVRARYLIMIGIVAFVTGFLTHYPGHMIDRKRNFFGAMAIYDVQIEGLTVRAFTHGNTLHGSEVLGKDASHRIDSGYYLQDGPIRRALDISHGKTVAVVGLGAGQLACYDPKLTIDFYEIDQDVKDEAERNFTYLKHCPPRRIIIGDGRIMLEKQTATYDVILLDAFNSDGIPLHLLTKEAIDIYKRRLNKNGILLFHISNRYLDLAPPLTAIARAENVHGYTIAYSPAEKTQLRQSSEWFVFAANENQARAFEKGGWQSVAPQSYVWTDDRSSVVSAMTTLDKKIERARQAEQAAKALKTSK